LDKEKLNKIKKIIEEIADSNEIYDLGLDDDFVELLNFDSMTFIQVIVRLESEFNVTIDDDDLTFENLNTLKKLHDYVTAERSESVR